MDRFEINVGVLKDWVAFPPSLSPSPDPLLTEKTSIIHIPEFDIWRAIVVQKNVNFNFVNVYVNVNFDFHAPSEIPSGLEISGRGNSSNVNTTSSVTTPLISMEQVFSNFVDDGSFSSTTNAAASGDGNETNDTERAAEISEEPSSSSPSSMTWFIIALNDLIKYCNDEEKVVDFFYAVEMLFSVMSLSFVRTRRRIFICWSVTFEYICLLRIFTMTTCGIPFFRQS